MALQDFTTWELYDENEDLVITSTSISCTSITDFSSILGTLSSSRPANFEFYYKINFSDMGSLTDVLFVVYESEVRLITNWFRIGDVSGFKCDLSAYYDEEDPLTDTSIDLSFDTDYYVTFKRVDNDVTLIFKTGSHTGSVVDTLTLIETYHSDISYMYYQISNNGTSLIDNEISYLYDASMQTGINYINIGDTWKGIDVMKINIGDTWKSIYKGYLNIGDSWKQVYGPVYEPE